VTAGSLVTIASPAQAAPAHAAGTVAVSSSGQGSGVAAAADVVAAMQRDLGMTEQQAQQRLVQQTRAMKADQQAQKVLGSSFGGSWFDARSGQLVVGVTSAGDVAKVSALGVQARVVARRYSELQGVAADLDRLAGKQSTKAGARAVAGKRQAAVAGLVSWRVDPASNRVVVSSVKGRASQAAMGNLAKYGDAVQMEYLPAAPTQAADFMDGGDIINLPGGGFCSAGFNLRNPSTGQGYLLIAGHCVQAGQTVTGQGGVTFGVVQQSFFPTYDDAIIQATNSAFWIQGHWVDTNPANGGVITITGFTDAPVGTTVCKSGMTTKLTCGTITAKLETVTFDGVNTVFGETRHSACVEKGDSGGSNYVPGAPNTAEGVTSGAVLYGATLRCGSAVGQPTISWYFPFANSISFYGPAYGVSLWP
jgi:streptogrisin C